MPSNVNHTPTAVTVTTTPTLIVPAAVNRSGVLYQNQDASAAIRLRFGSTTAAPYLLAAGASLPDTTTQNAVYADVASGTATLFVSVIK